MKQGGTSQKRIFNLKITFNETKVFQYECGPSAIATYGQTKNGVIISIEKGQSKKLFI